MFEETLDLIATHVVVFTSCHIMLFTSSYMKTKVIICDLKKKENKIHASTSDMPYNSEFEFCLSLSPKCLTKYLSELCHMDVRLDGISYHKDLVLIAVDEEKFRIDIFFVDIKKRHTKTSSLTLNKMSLSSLFLAGDETLTGLAIGSYRKVLEMVKVRPEDVDLIFMFTSNEWIYSHAGIRN